MSLQIRCEIVRKVTGQSLGGFFRQEIAEPMEADFHIGTPESVFSRIVNLIPPEGGDLAGGDVDPNSVAGRGLGEGAIAPDPTRKTAGAHHRRRVNHRSIEAWRVLMEGAWEVAGGLAHEGRAAGLRREARARSMGTESESATDRGRKHDFYP